MGKRSKGEKHASPGRGPCSRHFSKTHEPKVDKANPVVPVAQNHLYPSWTFWNVDNESSWPLWREDDPAEFWTDVYPRLQDLEKQTWNDLLVGSKRQHHTVQVEDLNLCAKKRLEQRRYDTQGTRLVSLRVDGTHRLYGFREGGVFSILWYDRDHGDNDTCVIRSVKKHT